MSGPTSLWLGRLRLIGLELGQGFIQLLYPGSCEACSHPLPATSASICDSCRVALTTDPYLTCPRCAGSVGPFVHLADGCHHCRGESFHFERVQRLGPYEGLLRQAILRMKQVTGERLAEALGDLWADRLMPRLQQDRPDLIVPVPLHWRRRLERGYNQSQALAERLALRLSLPCRRTWLRRIRNNPHQAAASATVRRQNLRGSFEAKKRPSLKGKTVLLVDDVLTSGSTASDAARALREAGAARVLVAVLARSA